MPFGSPLALQLATHKALGMGMAEEQKQQWEISGLAPSRPALTIALILSLILNVIVVLTMFLM